jgi:uncharacterized phage protein (TIGR02220 family)
MNEKCSHCNGTGVEPVWNNKPGSAFYKQVIDCLNKNAGTSYRYKSKSVKSLIDARFAEGWTKFEDYKLVIEKKCHEWYGCGVMGRYLRPKTLFSPKFNEYHGQQWAPTPGQTRRYKQGRDTL